MNISILKDGNYLPLLCILLYMTSAPLGLCSIPFMYIAELYPLQVKIGFKLKSRWDITRHMP